MGVSDRRLGRQYERLALAAWSVIFVHGNTRDAGDWDEPGRSVKQRFLEAGYSKQELWAPSYNGKSTKENPRALQCRTDNTSNIPDLAAFVYAVLDYTGASKVDLVAHSVGVTLVRGMLKANPDLSYVIRKFVAIARPQPWNQRVPSLLVVLVHRMARVCRLR